MQKLTKNCKLEAMKKGMKILLFCFCSLMLISWDRTSKELAKEHLKDKEPISYFHNTVRLEYVENTGAAMSLGDNLSRTASFWLLSILPLAFLLGMFVYTIKKSNELDLLTLSAIALVFAGGMGNIIDRLLFDRHVTDFMNIGFGNLRTGIFNFADICVTSGAIIFLVFYKRTSKVFFTK
jgi:signal peptidase II